MTKKRKRPDDFQKIKFKVGKKKLKPNNVTETSFKTKAIYVPDQLKENGTLPTNNRKLNVKELLTQLHHYNAGVKQGALTGLKDLLAQHSSVIDAHLSSIVTEVAAVFTDKDSAVRVAAVRLLRFLAPRTSEEQIGPFFPLISAHLSSAMTHIVEGIQEDALKVLDILLDHYPALLIDHSGVLLKNFVELISHQKLSKGLGKGGKASAWMLSVNPDRRFTSQQWHLSVLVRLKKLLSALTQGMKREEAEEEAFELKELPKPGTQGASEISWEQLATKQQSVHLYEHSGSQPWVNSQFKLRSLVDGGAGSEGAVASADSLKSFMQTLLPLMIECWVEACPPQFGVPIHGSKVDSDSMLLMQQVISIIQLLWKRALQQDETCQMRSWLRDGYLEDFKHHFMKHFPYSVQAATKQKKKKISKSEKDDASLLTDCLDHDMLNLTICQVMVALTSAPTLQQDTAWLEKIRYFVTENLEDGSILTPKQLSAMVGLVWKLVHIQRSRAATEALLKAVYSRYKQKGLALPVRTVLLKFFSGLYLRDSETNPHISGSRVLSRWLAGLPLQLVQLGSRNPVLSAQLIDTIHAAVARSHKELILSLQSCACRLYDPQDGTLVLLPTSSQQHLVQLLYFLPSISSELLSCLSRCCTMGRLSTSLATFLIRILHVRSSFSGWPCAVNDNTLTDADYFSFLFSTLSGCSAEELTWLQRSSRNPHVIQTALSPIRLYLTDLDLFLHHYAMTEVVCHCLSSVKSRSQCFDVLQTAVCKYLGVLTIIPDSTAGAVLNTVGKLLSPACSPSENLLKFLASCCYIVLHVISAEKNNSEHAPKREMLWGSCLSALTSSPHLMRLMLQGLHISEASQEELRITAQILRLLLQHFQLRSYLTNNMGLVQQIVQDITNHKKGDIQEQWLAELHYCFSILLPAQSTGHSIANSICS
ncbi:testis-expressed protein 10 [Protopterus annectens]|uniref:testis-expressed protein 10 n=1 Tax=Protopterus annectens TaxID=7888 RepID=UPI001CFA198F|nr:testis-expressed protein 10 [Protopterus annectens]XP_043920873.1 testis-expressed protein 10 [Protopterus annectens]XP_043920874.1 testis-expressed protein 10 [Protopterus annectens]XP_043920876.1 testis-expressed protein 10 [Protopterus annectens]XP_043920877.1 testis-expressed protein 10 [Protopterus annectens]